MKSNKDEFCTLHDTIEQMEYPALTQAYSMSLIADCVGKERPEISEETLMLAKAMDEKYFTLLARVKLQNIGLIK